jgi:hypothetical protein
MFSVRPRKANPRRFPRSSFLSGAPRPSLSKCLLEAKLPSLGVVLPSGSQLKGGRLSADLGIVGPVDKLGITGPVRLTK